MKRIVASILVWIVFVGGLFMYMNRRDRVARATPEPARAADAQAVAGGYALEVTPSFAVAPDPFGLQTDPGEQPPALVVRMGNQEVLRVTDTLAAGEPVRVDSLTGIVHGDNELYVEASPPLDQAHQRHALRLVILKDNRSLFDQTFWSSAGGKIAHVMRFTLAEPDTEKTSHEN